MRLTLKNFRCHVSRTFEIPDSGMTLIRGKRGSGKSTILNALFFALYGKARRPYSHGIAPSAECSVKLEDPLKVITITRSCRPNRLVVNYKDVDYEDDAGQGVIESIYRMNMDQFQISSYFDQKKHGSILSMTASEQLHLVEMIAFVNSDHEAIKEKIKHRIKELEKEQIDMAAQITLLSKQVVCKEHALEKHPTLKDIDLKEYDLQDLRQKHSLATTSFKKIGIDLEQKRSQMAELRKIEEANKAADEINKTIGLEIEFLIRQRNSLGDCPTEEMIDELQIIAKNAQQFSENLHDLQEIQLLQKEFNQRREEIFIDLNERLSCLRSNRLPDTKRMIRKKQIEEYEMRRKNYELYLEATASKKAATREIAEAKRSIGSIFPDLAVIKDNRLFKKYLIETASDLKVLINDLSTRLELLNRDNYICPKCETSLVWNDDEKRLEEKIDPPNRSDDLDDNNLEMRLVSTQLRLSTLENALVVFDKALDRSEKTLERCKKPISLKQFQSFSLTLSNQERIDKEIEQLSASLEKLNDDVSSISDSILSQLMRKIKEKQSGIPESFLLRNQPIDLSEIQEAEKIALLKRKEVEDGWNTLSDYKSFSREIEICKKRLDKKRFLKPDTTNPIRFSTLQVEMITLEQEMSTLAVTIQELQEKISIAEQYDHYQKAKQEIADLENERSAREKDYHILENRIKGAYGLEKAAIDAEFISLEKTIASLNTHADLYLKQMFENELSAQLSIKRLTKKGDLSARPSIEVQVQYRGALYDDIDDLSGGERQQCDLAFLLAVNDMLGSDILLLDECLNNLDAEINMATLSYLRDLSINKRVLIVAHEAISGVFDNELPMKRSEDE